MAVMKKKKPTHGGRCKSEKKEAVALNNQITSAPFSANMTTAFFSSLDAKWPTWSDAYRRAC